MVIQLLALFDDYCLWYGVWPNGVTQQKLA